MARECPSCATEIIPLNGRCPICGYEFADRPRWGIKLVALILILLALYPLYELLLLIFGL